MESQNTDVFAYTYQVFKTKKTWKIDIYQNKKIIKTEFRDTASLCLAYALEFENSIVKGCHNA